MKTGIGSKLLEVILTCANMNAKQRFDKDMNKLLRKYSEKSSINARDRVIEYLSGQKGKVTNAVLEEADRLISLEYSKGISSIAEALKKKRTALYKHYKRKLPIIKAEWARQMKLPAGLPVDYYKEEVRKQLLDYKVNIAKAEATLSYSLNKIDLRTIKYLTEADILFIKNHSPDTPVAKAIKEALLQGKERGAFVNDISGKLSFDFSEYTPETFASKFSEYSYWEGVVSGYDTITKNSTVINDFQQAGYITYRWYTRQDERACDICNALHNKVFSVEKAGQDLEAYLKAAETGNYEDLKNIGAWLKSPEEAKALTEKDGYFPPAHFKCRCFVRMDLGYEYK